MTSTAADLEQNHERLNFEDLDALNNDFDEEYVEQVEAN